MMENDDDEERARNQRRASKLDLRPRFTSDLARVTAG
jgi:hypothetical protein